MRRRLVLAPVLFALALAAGSAASAAALVWRVRLNGAEATLIGSVHLLPPTNAWLTEDIREDLRRADLVMFEIPQDESARRASAAALARWAHRQDPRPLRALLGPSSRTSFESLLAADGLSPDAFDDYAPWYADTELSLRSLASQGVWETFGVEAQIFRLIPKSARPGAFETVEDQVRLYAEAPLNEQIAALEETVRQISADPEAYQRLETAFLSGDVEGIRREAVEPLRTRSPRTWRRLVVQRNVRWTRTLLKLLRRKKRIFVVVGVGHLVGPESVPALLRARGLDVEGP